MEEGERRERKGEGGRGREREGEGGKGREREGEGGGRVWKQLWEGRQGGGDCVTHCAST